MGIYTDDAILGLRILVEMPHGGGDYYVEHEFIDKYWKQNAIYYLPQFQGKPGVKIQTLHPFSTSHNLQTGHQETPGNIWIDNFYITVERLLK
jgi:hypothetical protein